MAYVISAYNMFCNGIGIFVLLYSADDIFISFMNIENGVLLMYTPEGVNSIANFITAYEESQ